MSFNYMFHYIYKLFINIGIQSVKVGVARAGQVAMLSPKSLLVF